MSFRVGVLGATGAVGSTILEILAERNFPVSELVPFASERSEGKPVRFGDSEVACVTLSDETIQGLDLVISSAGGSVSSEWAPKLVEAGAVVVDNTSFWRMHPEVPLVVQPDQHGRPDCDGDRCEPAPEIDGAVQSAAIKAERPDPGGIPRGLRALAPAPRLYPDRFMQASEAIADPRGGRHEVRRHLRRRARRPEAGRRAGSSPRARPASRSSPCFRPAARRPTT